MRPLGREDPRAAGAYQLLGVLGAGGMGRVYLGRDPGGRGAAVKIIRPEYAGDPLFRARFRREVEAARLVGGRWTARVLDADPDAERPYLVTEYVPGPSLADAVRRHGPLPPRSVAALGIGLAEALIAVHAAGVVHRDLKPSNVLLTLDGPVVIDFGIARAVDSTVVTQTGSLVGSPAFVSPEQILGTGIGPASDVFALGGALVFAASGSGPFDGAGTHAMIYAVLNNEPRLDGLPPDLRAVAAACLRKAPAERPRPAEVGRLLAASAGPAEALWAGWLPPVLATGLVQQAVDVLGSPGTGPREAAGGQLPGGPATPAEPPVSVGRTPTAGTATVGTATVGTAAGQGPFGTAGTAGTASAEPPGSGGRDGQWRVLAVVAAAAAMCLVIIVTAIVLVGSRGSGDEDRTAGRAPGSTAVVTSSGPPPATPGDGLADGRPSPVASAGSAGPTRPGPLPAGYVGTWQGRVTSRMGVIQDVLLTLRAGDSGAVVGHAEFLLVGVGELAAPDDVRCVGDLELVGLVDTAGTPGAAGAVGAAGGGAAGAQPGVVLRDLPGSGPNPTLLGLPMCTSGATSTLALTADGGLAFQSEAKDGGRPAGTLRRQG